MPILRFLLVSYSYSRYLLFQFDALALIQREQMTNSKIVAIETRCSLMKKISRKMLVGSVL